MVDQSSEVGAWLKHGQFGTSCLVNVYGIAWTGRNGLERGDAINKAYVLIIHNTETIEGRKQEE